MIRTLCFKFAEENLYKMLREMRYDEAYFIKFQKMRFLKVLVFLLFGVILSIFLHPVAMIAAIALAIYQWWDQYRRVKSKYNNFSFKRQLEFSKFERMLIPYLLQSNTSLYNVFNHMLFRLEDGHVKQCLERLIIEMNDNPNSVEPFKRFAEDASGTNSAVLFMTTLYDYQQNTSDPSVITELGKMASEELFNGVDEIIEFKLRKFDMFPTKLTMISLIIVGGYMVSMFINLFKEIHP